MHERYAISVLNAGVTGSRLISAEDLRPELQLADGTKGRSFADPLNAFGRMAGGADGLVSLRPEHLSGSGGTPDQPWGLAALEEVDEISVVAIPDVMPKPRVVIRHRGRDPRCGSPADTRVAASSEVVGEPPPAFDGQQVAALQSDLVAHCERLRDRVAILDVPGTVATPDDVPGWRRNLDTKYAAAYYPWLRVLDPLRLDGLTRDIPACGHVAGVYARGDLTVGVHKPPANEIVEGAADIVGGNAIDDVRHGDLNEIGVNVIRAQGGRGVRVAGARTLSSESEWRFVNVRRLVIMIEEAIDEQIQWSVFEPSDQNLWRDLDRVIRSFLLGLWQRGMLEGATASEAFFVTCDETTNLPGETDLGRITCLVGLQPPWPAEFVVIRIGRTESSTEFVELIGGGRA
jgi:phage tail sheath protein FI